MNKIIITLLIGGTLLFVSCSKEKAKLSGRLVGNSNVTLYLERVLPNGQQIVDSTVTNKIGEFKFNVKLPDGQPTIYNLWKENEAIPLLISPRERVKIHSVGSIARNYSVTGSQESERMRQFRVLMADGMIKLDSILTLYGRSQDVETRQELHHAYASTYIKCKQEHVRFIVSDPSSLTSLYALYQRLPNDDVLFDAQNDIIYYRTIADSTAARYPDSPYVKALQREVARIEASDANAIELNKRISAAEEQTQSLPEIYLPDMYGKNHRLSDFRGKVILIDFWSAAAKEATFNNAELKELYEKYHERGFEIYQVSVDQEATKPLWVTSLQQQKIPWVSVCNFRGRASSGVSVYNVQSVPTNFLVDRAGNIVGKNLFGDKLEQQLENLLR